MISGQAVEVRLVDRGSSLTEDAAAGAAVVTVDDPTPFDLDTLVLVSDSAYTVTDLVIVDVVDDDELTTRGQLTLDPPLLVDLTASEPVSLWSGVKVLDDLVVDVDFGDGDPVAVTLASGQRKDWESLEGALDPPVAVLVSDDLTELVDAPGYAPPPDLFTIDAAETAESAEERSTGMKPAVVRTATSGARAEMTSDENGGLFAIRDAVNSIVGIFQARIEDGITRLSFGTGGASPVRLRMRNSAAERVIEALTDSFQVFGELYARTLRLQQSSTSVNGWDGNQNVQRTTDTEGTTTFPYNMNGGGSVTAICRGDYQVSVGQVAGGQITLRFRNPDGSVAVNKQVTFDWSITSYIR